MRNIGTCLKDTAQKKSSDGCKSFNHYDYQRNPRYINIKPRIMCCGNCSFWEIKR